MSKAKKVKSEEQVVEAADKQVDASVPVISIFREDGSKKTLEEQAADMALLKEGKLRRE